MRGRLLKGTGLAVAAAILLLSGAAIATSMNTFVAMAEESSDFVIVPYSEWIRTPYEEFVEWSEVADDLLVLVEYNGTDDKVVIPEGVEIISYNAFYNNTNITEIVMPNSVKELTYYKMEGRGGDNGYSNTYKGAFENCEKLKNIELSNNITNIPVFTFCNCDSLEKINIKNVISISGGAFYGCDSLKRVELNSDCSMLSEITGEWTNDFYHTNVSEAGAFENCSSLEEVAGNVSIILKNDTFAGCNNLSKIEGIVNIDGTNALAGCIDSLIVNGGTIPAETFANCKVNSLVISKQLKKIGDYGEVDSYHNWVTHPAYLENVTEIFYEGTKDDWEKVSIPSDTSPERVHYNISELRPHEYRDEYEKAVFDETNQEYIIDATFCSSCKSKLAGGRSVKATKKIEKGNDIYLINENNALIAYVGEGGELVIPEGIVTSIEKDAFGGNDSIISLTIPEGVTHLNGYAFMAGIPSDTGTKPNIAPNMKTLYLPNSIQSIESYDEESSHYNLTAMGIYGKRYYIQMWVYAYTYMGLENVKEIYYNGTKDEWEKVEGIDELSEEVKVYFVKTEPVVETVSSVFTDVPDGKWYSKEILYVYKRGAMKGKSEGVFDPLALIQRSETIAMLYQLEGSPAVDTSKALFPDVTSKNWYNNAATWGKTNGIISGLSSGPDAGKFMPKNQITRQDFTKILYEYAKYKGYDVSVKSATSYTEVEDASLISKYARECMNWGYENKFIANGSNFKPKDNITRREAAVMLARFLEKYDYK